MGCFKKRCFTKRSLWIWKNHVKEYFVTIEIYDFSVSEDEVLSLKMVLNKHKQLVWDYKLGLLSKEWYIFVGSDLGKNTVKTQEGLWVRFGRNRFQKSL